MRVLITGGGGFIGKKLAEVLLRQDELCGKPIDHLVVADAAEIAGLSENPKLSMSRLDITDQAAVRSQVHAGFDAIFHLAAIVSANAEAHFDLGYRVNLDGTRYLLSALHELGTTPRLVFASSVAAYGGNLPAVIHDDFHLTPQTSYGAQKAASELLVADYNRKGFIDGRSLRLPTIVVRPGKPNKAASTFASSIIREPLAGQRAICPVHRESRMYILSPRQVVRSFIHAMELDSVLIGPQRSIVLPGITAGIGEMADALADVAGSKVAARIEDRHDPHIQSIVDGWPPTFQPERALSLGFEADQSVKEIIRAHIDDELEGQIAA